VMPTGTPGTGSIVGSVYDRTAGYGLPAALVHAIGSVTAIATTLPYPQTSGAYSFNSLPAGPYKVTASHYGYESLTEQIRVVPGSSTEAAFPLIPLTATPTPSPVRTITVSVG
jgi:hypothetical protein